MVNCVFSNPVVHCVHCTTSYRYLHIIYTMMGYPFLLFLEPFSSTNVAAFTNINQLPFACCPVLLYRSSKLMRSNSLNSVAFVHCVLRITGNLWFVQPIDCNAKHHIIQRHKFPIHATRNVQTLLYMDTLHASNLGTIPCRADMNRFCVAYPPINGHPK